MLKIALLIANALCSATFAQGLEHAADLHNHAREGKIGERMLTGEDATTCEGKPYYVITEGEGTGCELVGDCVQTIGFPGPYPLNSSCRIYAVANKFGELERFETESDRDVLTVFNPGVYTDSAGWRFSGNNNGFPPSQFYNYMTWTADGNRGNSEYGFRLCPRAECSSAICPPDTIYPTDALATENTRVCEGPICGTEADLDFCCQKQCRVGNHQDYADANLVLSPILGVADCSEGVIAAPQTCRLGCEFGYVAQGSVQAPLEQECLVGGDPFRVPFCVPEDREVPFTFGGLSCARYGRDCVGPASWPDTYPIVDSEDGEETCRFGLQGPYIAKHDFFELPGTHFLSINGVAYSGDVPPLLDATDGVEWEFAPDTSTVPIGPGFLVCAYAQCSSFTCPEGYVFECSNHQELCGSSHCGEHQSDRDVCCRMASAADIDAGLANASDAFNSGCLVPTTQPPVTTTTTTTQPRQAIGWWELRVNGPYIENDDHRNQVQNAVFLSLAIVIAGAGDPSGGTGGDIGGGTGGNSSTSHMARRLDEEEEDDGQGAEPPQSTPEIFVIPEVLPEFPLPSELNWKLAFQINKLGHSSENLESATLEELGQMLNSFMGDGAAHVQLSSAVAISHAQDGSPLPSGTGFLQVPYCNDVADWIDDYQLRCSTVWNFACTRLGTSNGWLESLNDASITFENLLGRANPADLTATEACCACGGGVCQPGSYILRGLQRGDLPEFCAPCPPGSFASDVDMPVCEPCELGKVMPDYAATSCLTASPGTFANVTGSLHATPCPPGAFTGTFGSTACSLCAPGTYADEEGATACKDCLLGAYSGLHGSTVCLDCPRGSYAALPGVSECTPCEVGSHNEREGQDACRPCDVATFAGVPGLIDCEACEVGSFTALTGQSACSLCAAGTFAGLKRSEECSLCPIGEFASDEGASSCLSCFPGTYFPGTGASECLACERGAFSSEAGQTLCTPCGSGNFSASTGQSVCDRCMAGTYAPVLGMSECLDCELGRVAASAGNSECDLCRPGSYADTSRVTECTRCDDELPGPPQHWTTMRLGPADEHGNQEWEEAWGASSIDDCGCRPGTQPDGAVTINYTHGGSPEDGKNGRGRGCVPCGEGMTCFGMGKMRILDKYAWDKSLGVYDCRLAIEEACPGGVPGVCKEGRNEQSHACAECLSQMVPQDDGSCTDCGGADYAVPVLFCIVCLVLVLVGYLMFDKPNRKRPHWTTLILVASSGQMLTVIQQIGIISSIRVQWRDPLRRFFLVVAEISFLDIDILRPQCVAALPPVNKYALRIFGVFFALAMICVAHVVSTFVQHRRKWRKRFPVLFCAVGTVVMAFFVSIVTTMLGPLQCKLHPNDKRTVAWYPSVLCWEGDDHSSLLAIGMIACIVPIIFMVICIWAVKVFKRKLTQADSAFLNTFAFLIFRYHGGAYWYGPILLVRNALLSVAPTMTSPVLQIIFLQVVMMASLVLTCRLMPWRVTLANYIDVTIHVCLLFVSMVAAFFVDQTPSSGVATVAMSALLFLPVMLVLMIVHALRKRWIQRLRKKYHFFLCHHKVGAGCFARLLKMRLLRTAGIRGKVFVDTDDLKNLDNLFDMVAQQLDTLVVLHSTYVLTRPWCIGELVTTHMHKVKLQVLRMSGVERVSDEFVENFSSYVPDFTALTERGIKLSNIQEALKWMQSFAAIQLPFELRDQIVDTAAAGLIKQIAKEAPVDLKHPDEPAPMEREEQVVIIADKKDIEAASTALIMKDIINPVLSHEFHKLSFVLSDGVTQLAPAVAKAILVCTNGVFCGYVFEVLLALHAKQSVLIPLMATSNFKFPTPQLLAEIPEMLDFEASDQEKIVLLVQSIFTEIAVDFQPAALSQTEAVLAEKAKEVAARLYSDAHSTHNLSTKMQLMVNKNSNNKASSSSSNIVVQASSRNKSRSGRSKSEQKTLLEEEAEAAVIATGAEGLSRVGKDEDLNNKLSGMDVHVTAMEFDASPRIPKNDEDLMVESFSC